MLLMGNSLSRNNNNTTTKSYIDAIEGCVEIVGVYSNRKEAR